MHNEFQLCIIPGSIQYSHCILSMSQWLHLTPSPSQHKGVFASCLCLCHSFRHLFVGRQILFLKKSLSFILPIKTWETDSGRKTCYFREAEKAFRWPSSSAIISKRELSLMPSETKFLWQHVPSFYFLCLSLQPPDFSSLSLVLLVNRLLALPLDLWLILI